MTALSSKNDCGVYTDREIIELPLDRKGWRGSPLAEIRLAFTDAGWRAQIAFSFSTGSMWSCSSPITDHDPTFPRRDDAIAHAIGLMRKRMDARCFEDGMQAQRKKILAWLDSLRPAQADLFAAFA